MYEQGLRSLLAKIFLNGHYFLEQYCSNFFSTQDLYYAFKKDWCYWQKGKKATKSWNSREEYDAMLERLEAMKQAKKTAKKGGAAKKVAPRRDPRVSSAAAVASRRVMARAALRELLDSIYIFFGSQVKAAQAVITPKPMPKAKASLTDRASQGFAEGLLG